MGKEVISQKQAIIIMSAFIVGSSAVLGDASRAKQDSWLVYLIAMAMAALIIPIYARISKLYPNQEFYTILSSLFGKVGGKIITLLYVWYAFHLNALIIRNFTEFVGITSLNRTPPFIFAFFAAALSIWTIKSGIEVMGRVLSIFFPIFIVLVITVSLLSIELFNFDNLMPFLYNGLEPVTTISFGVFAFPFAETVLFLYLMGTVKKGSSPYKIYYISLLIAGITLLSIAVRSVLVLGADNTSMIKFPSFISTRLIDVRNFLQRIESTVAISFMITGYAKSSVCLYAASKGISGAFNIKDYRKIVAPIGLLTAIFSLFIHKNVAEMFSFGRSIYAYYAMPFQVIIPIIIWITAEIKTKQKRI